MIERLLQPRLLDLSTRYPILTLTGPRQSGKTTLSRMAFPELPYVSLENPANRELAEDDPVAFFGRYGEGAVLEEVQQGRPDPDPEPRHAPLLAGDGSERVGGGGGAGRRREWNLSDHRSSSDIFE